MYLRILALVVLLTLAAAGVTLRVVDVGAWAPDSWKEHGAPSATVDARPNESDDLTLGASGERATADEEAPSGSTPAAPSPATEQPAPPRVAMIPDEGGSAYVGHAILKPMGASAAKGQITFAVSSGALAIYATVDGAAVGGHALVIHDGAACADRTGKLAAGAHLNPFNQPHGVPNAEASHVGDLGNVEVGTDGRGELRLYLHDAAYPVEERGGWGMLVGKPVVLYERADDGTTQPNGNAGNPIACGVIVKQAGGPH